MRDDVSEVKQPLWLRLGNHMMRDRIARECNEDEVCDLAAEVDAEFTALCEREEQIEAQRSDDAFGGALWDEVQKDKLAKMTAERDAALAQVQSLERDAARYAWLPASEAPAGHEGIVRQQLEEHTWRYLFAEWRVVRDIEGWFDTEGGQLANITHWCAYRAVEDAIPALTPPMPASGEAKP